MSNWEKTLGETQDTSWLVWEHLCPLTRARRGGVLRHFVKVCRHHIAAGRYSFCDAVWLYSFLQSEWKLQTLWGSVPGWAQSRPFTPRVHAARFSAQSPNRSQISFTGLQPLTKLSHISLRRVQDAHDDSPSVLRGTILRMRSGCDSLENLLNLQNISGTPVCSSSQPSEIPESELKICRPSSLRSKANVKELHSFQPPAGSDSCKNKLN